MSNNCSRLLTYARARPVRFCGYKKAAPGNRLSDFLIFHGQSSDRVKNRPDGLCHIVD